MRIAICLTMAALAAGPHASAQAQTLELALEKMAGTLAAAPSPSFANGELTGCGIEFNALVRNHISRSGAFDRVSGSFGFMSANGTIAPILKVIVYQFDTKTGALTPSPPTRAYVVNGGESNFKYKVASYPSDTPGALFTVFHIEPTTGLFFDALTAKRLSFRYGPSGSSMDVPVVVDLTVTETLDNGFRKKSDRPVDEMLSCMGRLLKEAGKQ